MSRQRFAGWAGVLLLLVACQGPAPAPMPPRPGEPPQAGRFTSHWNLLLSRYGNAAKPGESWEQPCYHTERLQVEVLRVLEVLGPPTTPAAEVLIAVDGAGTLEVQGKVTPFSGGWVAILPAGARGAVRVAKGSTLEVLVVRAKGAPARGGDPLLLPFERLVGRGSEGMLAGVRERRLGGVPGVSLHALEVEGDPRQLAKVTVDVDGKAQEFQLQQGYVAPHRRLERDQVLFLLRGSGSLGVADVGDLLTAGSVAGIPAKVTHYYANSDLREGTLALIVFAPGTDAASPTKDDELVFEGGGRPVRRPVLGGD